MGKLIGRLDIVISKCWLIFCCIIFGVSLLVKAMYNMADFPYFSLTSGVDILLLLLVCFGYLYLFKYRELIEQKISYWVLLIIFGFIGVLFIFFLPIKPFSDMQYVTEGALLFAKGDIDGILSSDYLQYITKNLKVAMFYGLFGIVCPKNVISLRIINVVLYLLIALFSGRIAKNLGCQYPKMVFVLVASFIPLILYCNHIYYDLPTYLLCIVAVYFYTKEKNNYKNLILTGIFLGLGCCMRILAFIFVIAILIDYILCAKKKLLAAHCRQLLMVFIFVAIIFAIPKTCDAVVNRYFRTENTSDESIWTLFWMGINEEEFGMMHNEIYGGNRTFEDFYTLLLSRDVKQNVKLFGRKIFWTWSQGTWQAQRYGFGGDAENALDKFEYETPLTRFFLNNEQLAPRFINSISRAQYMAFFLFMILGLLKMNALENERYRIFIYLCFGTFLILIFYEMKSRYILHCFITMIILGLRGMEYWSENGSSCIVKLTS